MPLTEDDVREILRLIDESGRRGAPGRDGELSLHVLRGRRRLRGSRRRPRAAPRRGRTALVTDRRADARHLLPRRGAGRGAVRRRRRARRAGHGRLPDRGDEDDELDPRGRRRDDRRGLRRERRARRVRRRRSSGWSPTREPLVDIVDTTTRDGNQSLWSATGLTTPDVLAIAPTIDRVGFHACDFTSSTHMARLRPLPPRGPVGADPARQRRDAATRRSASSRRACASSRGCRPTRT